MVKNCCVKSCKSVWTPTTDLSFFSFPFKNEALLKKWFEVIPSRGKIGKYLHICSDHFRESDYYVSASGNRCLKKDAVPNQFQYHVLEDITLHQNNVTETSSEQEQENFDCNKREQAEVKSLPRTKDARTQTWNMPPTAKEEGMRRKIKILQDRLRRREARISHVTQLVKVLKRNGNCSEHLEEILLQLFSGFNLELFANEVKNSDSSKTRKSYSKKMKEFASTLYFYSPKAYKFVRTRLNLPHESTLRKWVGESSCKAGFVPEVFQFLTNESLKSGPVKDVGLIFDSTSIRSQITVDQKENSFRGHVDFGEDDLDLTYNPTDLATEVLAFQIVSFSTKFKIPIAHFFINGITTNNQSRLLNVAIDKLYDVGVVVRSITCDGTTTNFSTLKDLKCNFSLNDMKTFFHHPRNNSKIFVILHPCHMIKLCRNALAEKEMYSSKGKISFQFIEKLHKLQEKEGFKFANRLSNTHVNYKNKKMKVSIAAQTISSGVADAIDFVREGRFDDFRDSDATTEFLRVFDSLFDMMNSRSAYGKGYKSPLSLSNYKLWNEKFNETEKYIRELRLSSQTLLESARKTFALGFLIDIQSFRGLVSDLFTQI